MARFLYEATNEQGAVIKGSFEADDRQGVVDHLVKRNLIPMSIEEVGGAKGERGLKSVHLFERFTPIDRILMIRNLAATVKAGVSLVEALDILIEDTTKKKPKEFLIDAKANVESGRPLSETFEKYKRDFPPIFAGMVRSAEASGQLDHTLEELAQYLTKSYSLQRKVKSALTYPVLLIIGTVGVVILLVVVVLPRLSKVFGQSGIELPLITKVLLNTSNFIRGNLVVDAVVLAFLVWFFTVFRKTKRGRALFLSMITLVPVAKDLIKKIALVRFSRTIASLLRSGITIIDALKLATNAMSNHRYEKALGKSVEDVTNGIPLSRTLYEYPKLFPRFFTSLLAVGEKTGTTEEVLKSFADFYDDEVDNTLKDLATILEPMLLLFMGIVIGLVALSILLPIYQFVGKFT